MTRQMTMTVWKAVLKPLPLQTIEVPEGTEFLIAREQHDKICVWYRCDPNAPKVARSVAIVGTGHAAAEPPHWHYIGTASLYGGSEMYHVFVVVLPLPEPFGLEPVPEND